ncbi:beta-ketoacyl-ACP synthase, partial [Pseudomonas sp. HMWF005]
MSQRRVVVTGMGLVSPLGSGVEAVWQRLLAGRSGLRALPDAVVADLPARVGGSVPTPEEDAEAGFDPDRATPPKEQKKMDRFILFAMEAARQALEQAGWHPAEAAEQERTATIIGSGVGGFGAIADAVRTTDSRGPRRLSPFTIPSFLV